MATVNANGDLQLEPEDILPMEVAHRTDDPQHVTDFINQINPTIKTSEDLAKAVAEADTMRREWREKQGLPKEEALAAPDKPVKGTELE